MYGMYGSVGSVGPQTSNPFIKKPGSEGVENNPFTAQKTDDKQGQANQFDPQKLFEGGTVGLKNKVPEGQFSMIG
jgi:hypothetical protein